MRKRDSLKLAREHGTPLFILDHDIIHARKAICQDIFEGLSPQGKAQGR
jgi:hypothetical protein